MTKELYATTSDQKALATQAPAGEKLEASDALLPSIYLMQSNSTFVTEQKAKVSEFVKSGTLAVIGSAAQPFNIIPLSFSKSFRIVNPKGNKWVRNEPWNPGKSDEWEFLENGLTLKRVKCINVLGLIPEEVRAEQNALKEAESSGEMFDLDKALKPVAIQFRSTSFKSAKNITDHFVMAQSYKAAPYSHIFKVGARKETNDDGTFFIMEVQRTDKTPKEFYATCDKWRNLIISGSAKVDESLEEKVNDTEENARF